VKFPNRRIIWYGRRSRQYDLCFFHWRNQIYSLFKLTLKKIKI